jgi:hypothetical protein
MNQLAIAVSLVRVDIRWRLLKVMYPMMAVLFTLAFWFMHLTDPRLIGFFVLYLALAISHFLGMTRIGFPYQLGLPISSRTLFLTTLLLTAVSIWIPAVILAVLSTVTACHCLLAAPVALPIVWMIGSAIIWLVWPARQAAPGAARVCVAVIQIAAAMTFVVRPPSIGLATALVLLSAALCLIAFLRFPPAFLSEQGHSGASSRSLGGGNAWFTLARILLPWSTIGFICIGVLQGGDWVLRGLWTCLIYSMLRSEQPVLLSLPISQVKFVYARLTFAFLLEMLLGSYFDPFGRLLKTHSSPGSPAVSALLTISVALVLVASGKLVAWHRLRHWSRRGVVIIPGVLFIGTFTLMFFRDMTNHIAASIPDHAAPAILSALILLLWLIAVQTRESDYLAVSAPATSPFAVFNRA